MTQAYPLKWPEHRPRKPAGLRRRGGFQTSVHNAIKRVMEHARLMGATGVVVSTNIETRNDGLPRSNQRDPDDPGVCVYFHLDDKPHSLPCDTYDRVENNIAAIAAHMGAMRTSERHGVASLAEMFSGFAALPPPTGSKPKRPWWEVLGMPQAKYGKHVIDAVYKAKVRECHPDTGGSNEAFQELNAAREEALS